ncbi:hypothetical protein F4557_005756 [Actinomadura catellatispora]|uniref:Uncharacterized protein n=1 Tax=Actinomadura livida TaxID=79909 RepID=A0A7W7N000_9ACTN|nr:hypothetical protein [Actinomadura catellatispora]
MALSAENLTIRKVVYGRLLRSAPDLGMLVIART